MWSGIGRRLGLFFSSTSGSFIRAVIAAAAISFAIGLEPMAPQWLTLQRKLQLLGGLGRRAKPVRPVPGKLMAQLLDQDRLCLHLGQEPRGEAAQLLGVFRQGQGLIQHERSLSHCIRCGNH
jgi:hypothetical protein